MKKLIKILKEIEIIFQNKLQKQLDTTLSILAGHIKPTLEFNKEIHSNIIKIVKYIDTEADFIDDTKTKLERNILNYANHAECKKLNQLILDSNTFNHIELLYLYESYLPTKQHQKIANQLQFIFTGTKNTPNPSKNKKVRLLIQDELLKNNVDNQNIINVFCKPDFTYQRLYDMQILLNGDTTQSIVNSPIHQILVEKAQYNYLNTAISTPTICSSYTNIEKIASSVSEPKVIKKILDNLSGPENADEYNILNIVATFQKYNNACEINEYTIYLMDYIHYANIEELQYLNKIWTKKLNETINENINYIGLKTLKKYLNWPKLNTENKKSIKSMLKLEI